MADKCQLLAVTLSALIRLTTQSIAGVTYMDDFDFEERYRNVYECDPFHWYPLHLPPHCTKMYEELIRSRVTALTRSPVRVVKEKESVVYNLNPSLIYSRDPYYEIDYSQESYEQSPLTPYIRMFQMLRKDVMREPSVPKITYIPGLGVSALYNQPISRKSGDYIKDIAGAYRDAHIKLYNEYFDNDSADTTNSSTRKPDEVKEDGNKVRLYLSNDKHKKNIKKKIQKGDILAIFKSKQN